LWTDSFPDSGTDAWIGAPAEPRRRYRPVPFN
jgi:hypothetical protein